MQKIQNSINSHRNKSIAFAKQSQVKKRKKSCKICQCIAGKKLRKSPLFSQIICKKTPLKICLLYKQKTIIFQNLVTARKLQILSLYYQKKLQNSYISSEKKNSWFSPIDLKKSFKNLPNGKGEILQNFKIR